MADAGGTLGALKRIGRTLWRGNLLPAPARRVIGLAYVAGMERAEERRERREPARLGAHPLVRLVVPVRGQRPAAVRATVASVRRQGYERWELYVVPDATGPLPPAVVRGLGRPDPRVTVWHAPPSPRPNAALDAAFAAPGADYVALIDPGDTLAGDALLRVARRLGRSPGADVVYTDEQVGRWWRTGPAERVYKPDWSPEHALSEPYVGRLCAFRRALVVEVGGFGDAFDLAREYDLLLRLHERAVRVAHEPGALYHRSTAGPPAPADAWRDEVGRAVARHLRRVGAEAEYVAPAGGGAPRVRHRVRGAPLVSIVIPTVGTMTREVGGRAVDLLANTVRSVAEHTEYRNFEIVYVHDRPLRPETLAVLAGSGVRVRAVPYDRPFNWSDKTNVGAAVAEGEHLLALNDDVEVADGGWLSAMLEYSQQDAVGAVGAKLLFPDGSIQHAGVVLNRGSPAHPYHGCPPARQGGVPDLAAVRNYLAVTGACLMTRTSVFREVGGFSPEFAVNYNDVDYCLRVRARGYRVVFTPHAWLYHLESVSRAQAGSDRVHAADLARLARAWPDECARDPYHDARRRSVWLW